MDKEPVTLKDALKDGKRLAVRYDPDNPEDDGEFIPLRADAAIWRKRLLQIPSLDFNHRLWTLGFSWDEDYFCLHFGPTGLTWDLWP